MNAKDDRPANESGRWPRFSTEPCAIVPGPRGYDGCETHHVLALTGTFRSGRCPLSQETAQTGDLDAFSVIWLDKNVWETPRPATDGKRAVGWFVHRKEGA